MNEASSASLSSWSRSSLNWSATGQLRNRIAKDRCNSSGLADRAVELARALPFLPSMVSASVERFSMRSLPLSLEARTLPVEVGVDLVDQLLTVAANLRVVARS